MDKILLDMNKLRELNFSVSTLSLKAQISYPTLCKYFRPEGQASLPSLPNARKLAATLGMPLEQIQFMGELV